jgi:dimethyladenosine transferase 1
MASRLPPLPSIRDIIRLYGLSARKQLSQNFLLDLNITDRIVRHCGTLDSETRVLEVGPGAGGLTRSLLNTQCHSVTVVEKDKRFLPALESLQQADQRLRIKCSDILEVNEASLLDAKFFSKNPKETTTIDDGSSSSNLSPPLLLIGNLPFGVATTLLLKWLKMIHHRQRPFQSGLSRWCCSNRSFDTLSLSLFDRFRCYNGSNVSIGSSKCKSTFIRRSVVDCLLNSFTFSFCIAYCCTIRKFSIFSSFNNDSTSMYCRKSDGCSRQIIRTTTKGIIFSVLFFFFQYIISVLCLIDFLRWMQVFYV